MKEFETQFENARNIKLTESEKNLMRSNIVNLMRKTRTVSPYSILSIWMKPVLTTIGTLVIIIVGISGISISASSALPGDFLYGIKVHVNEEVAGVLISSPKQKLIWQEERIQKRISEIHTLAKSGELTTTNTLIAVKAIDTNIADLNINATELASSNPEIVKAVAATIDKDTKVEAKTINDASTRTTPAIETEVKKLETSDVKNETKIEIKDIVKNLEVTTSTTTAIAIPDADNKKLEEDKNLQIIKNQVSDLKDKIAKEKLHLESLTKENLKDPSVKSDIINTTLDITIQ